MNPLTVQARRNYAAEKRAETRLCIVCGLILAALCISFI